MHVLLSGDFLLNNEGALAAFLFLSRSRSPFPSWLRDLHHPLQRESVRARGVNEG